MPLYRWNGINHDGKSVKGMLEMATPNDLCAHLIDQKIALLNYKISTDHREKLNRLFRARILSHQDLLIFFKQLSHLISHGMEIVQALKIIQQSNPWQSLQNFVGTVFEQLQAGLPLYEVLQKNQVCDQTTIEIIKMGEQTGKLPIALYHVTSWQEQRMNVAKNIRRSLLIPFITALIASLLCLSVIIFVIPHFAQVYKTLDCKLPPTTQALLGLSTFLRTTTTQIALVIGAVLILLTKKYWATNLAEKLKLIGQKTPLFSDIYSLNDHVTAATMIALYLQTGLPLALALEHGLQAVKLNTTKQAITACLDQIKQGISFSSSLTQTQNQFFDIHTRALVALGEHTGTLEQIMNHIAQYYQERLEKKLFILTSLITPLTTVGIGLLIGIMMIIIYLPILKLGTNIHF